MDIVSTPWKWPGNAWSRTHDIAQLHVEGQSRLLYCRSNPVLSNVNHASSAQRILAARPVLTQFEGAEETRTYKRTAPTRSRENILSSV